MSLPICTGTEKQFAIFQQGGAYPFGAGFPTDSPAQSCAQFANSLSGTVSAVSQHSCQWSGQPAQVYPIVQMCTADLTSPFNAERMVDMAAMWGMFLAVCIVVLGLRKLYDVFDKAPHGD